MFKCVCVCVCVGGGRGRRSQEGLDVDVQGGAGHGELEAVDDVGMQDPEPPDALPSRKDLGAAPWEEGGVCRAEKTKNDKLDDVPDIRL